MNILTSIKNKLHIGREITMGENSKTGETGAKINTEDKVSLSSGSGEEKNSMSLKDAATSGGVGFAIGLGVGNNGRIKNLENEVNTMKSGKKSDPPMTMEDGKQPPITLKEMKMLKMISRQAFKDEFKGIDFGVWGSIGGVGGLFASAMVAAAIPTSFPMVIGIIGVGTIASIALKFQSCGQKAAKEAREDWLYKFSNSSETESMVELNKKYPELWAKMMKKG